MPKTSTAKHPVSDITITFYEFHEKSNHLYIDDQNPPVTYTSGTTFVHGFFPPFPKEQKAGEIAARENKLVMEVLMEWEQAGIYGTHCHEYAEAIITGTAPPKPLTPKEQIAFRAIDKAVAALSRQYDFWGCERIVFDPLYDLCGTIDLVAQNKQTKALAILDWKTNKKLYFRSFNAQHGLYPIEHIEDCNMNHYTLQLSFYAQLMLGCGYVPENTPVELAIIYIPPFGDNPEWYPLNFLQKEIIDMINEREEHRYAGMSQMPIF